MEMSKLVPEILRVYEMELVDGMKSRLREDGLRGLRGRRLRLRGRSQGVQYVL